MDKGFFLNHSWTAYSFSDVSPLVQQLQWAEERWIEASSWNWKECGLTVGSAEFNEPIVLTQTSSMGWRWLAPVLPATIWTRSSHSTCDGQDESSAGKNREQKERRKTRLSCPAACFKMQCRQKQQTVWRQKRNTNQGHNVQAQSIWVRNGQLEVARWNLVPSEGGQS